MSSPLLEIRGLEKIYDNGVHALRNVSFAVERGDPAKDIGFGGRPDEGFLAQQRGIGGGQRGRIAISDARRVGQRRVDL